MGPLLEHEAGLFKGRLNCHGPANSTLAAEYEVSSIPTVLLFVGGEIKARWVGLRPKNDYRAAIDEQTL